MSKKKILSILRFAGETFVYVFVTFLLYESVIVAQDNQSTLNEMADRLNGLNNQVAEVKTKVKLKTSPQPVKVVYIHKRVSGIQKVQQWLGSKLKY